jgi:hypothetical protein
MDNYFYWRKKYAIIAVNNNSTTVVCYSSILKNHFCKFSNVILDFSKVEISKSGKNRQYQAGFIQVPGI